MTEETERRCDQCQQFKTLSKFTRSGYIKLSDGTKKRYPLKVCKACYSKKVAEQNRRWREKNKARIHENRESLKKPGAERVRALKEQAKTQQQKADELKRLMEMDIPQMVEEVKAVAGTDQRIMAQIERFERLAQSEREVDRGVGRGGLFGLLNDARAERARRKFQIA